MAGCTFWFSTEYARRCVAAVNPVVACRKRDGMGNALGKTARKEADRRPGCWTSIPKHPIGVTEVQSGGAKLRAALSREPAAAPSGRKLLVSFVRPIRRRTERATNSMARRCGRAGVLRHQAPARPQFFRLGPFRR